MGWKKVAETFKVLQTILMRTLDEKYGEKINIFATNKSNKDFKLILITFDFPSVFPCFQVSPCV